MSTATTASAKAAPINRVQAARAAKQYLKFMPFSFRGMVEQLQSDGYSMSDATYGARAAGL